MGSGSSYRALAELLRATLNVDGSVRKQAEVGLTALAQQEDFVETALGLTTNASFSLAERQGAAIAVKNLVNARWDSPFGSGGLTARDRHLLQSKLPEYILDEALETRIGEILMCIIEKAAEADFPHNWNPPDILAVLMKRFGDPKQVGVKTTATLWHLLSVLFSKFNSAERSNETLGQVKICLEYVPQRWLAALGCLTDAAREDVRRVTPEHLRGLLFLSRVFYSLNCIDLPEFFEDNCEQALGAFGVLLALPNDIADPQLANSIKTQICINFKLYTDRYQEEVAPFVSRCSAAVVNLLVFLPPFPEYDEVATCALQMLSSAARTKWPQKTGPFDDPKALHTLCQQVLLKQAYLSDRYVEALLHDPRDFITADLNGQAGRRGTTTELIENLMKHYSLQVTEFLTQVVQNLSATADQHETDKDAAIFLTSAMACITETRTRGVTQMNPAVRFEEYYSKFALPELENPHINERPIAKAAALKCCARFLAQFSPLVRVDQLAKAARLLDSNNVVVHSYAAICLERSATLRDLNDKPLVDYCTVKSVYLAARDSLAKIITTDHLGGSNDIAMRCLHRLLVQFYRNGDSPLTLPVLGTLVTLLTNFPAAAPNPLFAHGLFENLAIILRDRQNAVSAEGEFVPILGAVLNKSPDYAPYSLQIIGLLVDVSSSSKEYAVTLNFVLPETAWTATANVPGIIRVLTAFLRKWTVFAPMLTSNYPDVLKRLNFCLFHKKLQLSAVDLWISLIRYSPKCLIQTHLAEMLTMVLTKLQETRPEQLCERVVVALCLLMYKHQAADLVLDTLASLQPGLEVNFLKHVFFATAKGIACFYYRKVVLVGLALLTISPRVLKNADLVSAALEILGTLVSNDIGHSSASMGSTDGHDDPLNRICDDQFDVSFVKLLSVNVESRDLIPELENPVLAGVRNILMPFRFELQAPLAAIDPKLASHLVTALS